MRNIDSTYPALPWRGAFFFFDWNWLRQIPANGERALVKLFEPAGVGWHAPRYSEGRDESQYHGLRCNSACATRPKEATKTNSCHCLYSSSTQDTRKAALAPTTPPQFSLTFGKQNPILLLETRPRGDLRVAPKALSLFLCAPGSTGVGHVANAPCLKYLSIFVTLTVKLKQTQPIKKFHADFIPNRLIHSL
jgi:hypothetical protein